MDYESILSDDFPNDPPDEQHGPGTSSHAEQAHIPEDEHISHITQGDNTTQRVEDRRGDAAGADEDEHRSQHEALADALSLVQSTSVQNDQIMDPGLLESPNSPKPTEAPSQSEPQEQDHAVNAVAGPSGSGRIGVAFTADRSQSREVTPLREGGEGSGSWTKKGRPSSLTEAEKKAKIKDQNRQAATRSRNKRKEETDELEAQVKEIEAENAKLRAKLQSLKGTAKPDTVQDGVQPQSTEVATTGTDSTAIPPTEQTVAVAATNPAPAPAPEPMDSELGVDHTYLSKVQSELVSYRTTLLKTHLELAALRSGKPDHTSPLNLDRMNDDSENHHEDELPPLPGTVQENMDILRKTLLHRFNKYTYIKSEFDSLASLVVFLRDEKDNVTKQMADVKRELDVRRGLVEPVVHDAQPVDKLGPQVEDEAHANVEGEIEGHVEMEGEVEGEGEGEASGLGDTVRALREVEAAANAERAESERQTTIAEEEDGGSNKVSTSDRNLMDIRGWVDEAVRNWEQTGEFPTGDADR